MADSDRIFGKKIELKGDKMKIQEMNINELKRYENNPRKNAQAVEAVAESIKEFGWKQPIVIDKNNEIVAGDTRFQAAIKLGLETVPVVIADDLTAEQIKAYRLADNKTNELADWDFEKLQDELEGIEDLDMSLFGEWQEEMDESEVDFENLDELAEDNDEYNEFVDKFKPKKTTDDCYTPPAVYEAVLNWVKKEYGISDDATICRPFYPGGDYKKYKYPDGCVVVDNPPFSILAEIKKWYSEKNIKYFLFAPHLTLFANNSGHESYIVTNSQIIYENGANVKTSFVNNLDTCKARTAPALSKAIDKAVAETKETVKLPKYDYPNEVITAAILSKIADIDFKVYPEDCYFVRQLDSQKEKGAALYGAGFLISEKAAAEKAAAEKAAAEKAAAEKAAAEKWQLSEREWEIVKSLGK